MEDKDKPKEPQVMRVARRIPPLVFMHQSKYYRKQPNIVRALRIHYEFEVETREGLMKGRAGDWLIEEVEGEFYPCRHSVFKKTYGEVR